MDRHGLRPRDDEGGLPQRGVHSRHCERSAAIHGVDLSTMDRHGLWPRDDGGAVIASGEAHELVTSGEKPEIVETVPGWTHGITNVGTDEMVVMLWANEVFDRARPDTFACPL